MSKAEIAILDSVSAYERESGRVLPVKSFYKSIALEVKRKNEIKQRS